ncbi:alanine racemase [Ornithinicoccus hortensis]|uniref:Diaminopimelate decarboxylase n=1 Tax=Ornithinicoccus hortensis TaxID=82346 RepID=A0A542YM61_9MICO|nr:alanine racemase [Ornithinicoccus hortensis]TQL49054.1 diaminopimelate decarboxylase [Ornithinicoccus hortensis]
MTVATGTERDAVVGVAGPPATTPAPARLFALDDEQVRELAARGTPCFGYDLDLARERFRTLRATLPDRVLLAYAVKSNPGPPLLRALAAEGAWFDCASAGEVEAVRIARRESAQAGSVQDEAGMVLAGPAKSVPDLLAGLDYGARVQVDGIEDVARLAALHDGAEPLPVNVRVHPATGVSESASIIGGAGPSAFGVDEEDLPAFVAAVADHPRVRLAGLQVFSASNELDAGALLANHRTALAIGERLHREHGVELELIDLGGGLGIPYAEGLAELDTAALGAGLAGLLAEHPWFTGQLLLEPGRWLSGPTGVYVSRVVRVKASRGTTFAVLEGGINHLLRPLLTGQSFPVRSATERPGERTTYSLAGPLCTSLDRVGTAELGPLEPGDLLVFGQAGAYAYTQAMTHFLSHPVPEQHWFGG